MNTSSQASILLVDDMEEMRNIVRRLLMAMGFQKITLARHGEEAWRMMQMLSFDLVLCDWNMPNVSGRELLARVRQDTRFATLPFIMLTGENTAGQVKSAIEGGVTDFVIKPFTMALLESRIRACLAASASSPTEKRP